MTGERLVHQLVRERAALNPGAIAVEDGDIRLTYEQLNKRAERLAARLRRVGVGPDQLVAVCLDRSADLVVTFLAVLKAGGAYVPLDADYPAARLAFILADTRACWVVTNRQLVSCLPSEAGLEVLYVDEDGGSPLDESTDEIDIEVAARKPCIRHLHLRVHWRTQGSSGTARGNHLAGREHRLSAGR